MLGVARGVHSCIRNDGTTLPMFCGASVLPDIFVTYSVDWLEPELSKVLKTCHACYTWCISVTICMCLSAKLPWRGCWKIVNIGHDPIML